MGHMVNIGAQSSTVKSYKSAIKKTLCNDGYPWDDNKLLMGSLTRACKLENDEVKTRLPITGQLLEAILFELERKFKGQPYLKKMYKAIFILAYYGMMRISEIVGSDSDHVVKAANVSIAHKKRKILLVLYSSKTHGKADPPQKIWVKGLVNGKDHTANRFFCPYAVITDFLIAREPAFTSIDEPFIIFRDRTQPHADVVRKTLHGILQQLHLDRSLYDTQSFRIGRTSDLVLKFNINF